MSTSAYTYWIGTNSFFFSVSFWCCCSRHIVNSFLYVHFHKCSIVVCSAFFPPIPYLACIIVMKSKASNYTFACADDRHFCFVQILFQHLLLWSWIISYAFASRFFLSSSLCCYCCFRLSFAPFLFPFIRLLALSLLRSGAFFCNCVVGVVFHNTEYYNHIKFILCSFWIWFFFCWTSEFHQFSYKTHLHTHANRYEIEIKRAQWKPIIIDLRMNNKNRCKSQPKK